MVQMSLRDLAEFGHLLGHSATEIKTLRDGRYFIECSCGYRCTGRQTQRLAVEAITHHLYGLVKAYVASGKDLPTSALAQPFGVSPLRVKTAG
jgi:hypothetical protein